VQEDANIFQYITTNIFLILFTISMDYLHQPPKNVSNFHSSFGQQRSERYDIRSNHTRKWHQVPWPKSTIELLYRVLGVFYWGPKNCLSGKHFCYRHLPKLEQWSKSKVNTLRVSRVWRWNHKTIYNFAFRHMYQSMDNGDRTWLRNCCSNHNGSS